MSYTIPKIGDKIRFDFNEGFLKGEVLAMPDLDELFSGIWVINSEGETTFINGETLEAFSIMLPETPREYNKKQSENLSFHQGY